LAAKTLEGEKACLTKRMLNISTQKDKGNQKENRERIRRNCMRKLYHEI